MAKIEEGMLVRIIDQAPRAGWVWAKGARKYIGSVGPAKRYRIHPELGPLWLVGDNTEFAWVPEALQPIRDGDQPVSLESYIAATGHVPRAPARRRPKSVEPPCDVN